MIFKYHGLKSQLKNNYLLYVLVGEDLYLLNEARLIIKKHWNTHSQCDEKSLEINNTVDWHNLIEEANSYSLFSDYSLLSARVIKKTIDNTGKKLLSQYLQKPNDRCLIILTINIPIKQLQWLEKCAKTAIVQITSFTINEIKNWLVQELKTRNLNYETGVPDLIIEYCMGNLMACSQLIEKLSLLHEDGPSEQVTGSSLGPSFITSNDVKAQAIAQNEFNLYSLRDALLLGNASKTITLLRQARSTRNEPSLLLWLITNEIRQLIKLRHLLQQSIKFNMACQQLNIWAKQIKLYEQAIAKFSLENLYQLLELSKNIDQNIKTSHTDMVWHGFDKMAIAFRS